MIQLNFVDILFNDEVKALILLLSMLKSCLVIVTAANSSPDSTKLKLNDVQNLILSKNICRRQSREYFILGSTLSIESIRR